MKRFLFAIIVSAISFSFIACTSSPEYAKNLSYGSVSGKPMQAQSAVAHYGVVATETSGDVTTSKRGLIITISDKNDTCSEAHRKSSTKLVFTLPGEQVSLGTYPVVNAQQVSAAPGQAEADFDFSDSSCRDAFAETAESGTIFISEHVIDVSSPDDSHWSGAFELTFPSGHVSGHFSGLPCDELNNPPPPPPPETCTP